MELCTANCELSVNGPHRYSGANSCMNLQTIGLLSSLISSSMVLHLSSCISGLLGVLKLLFVCYSSGTILKALQLCNFH